MSRIISGLAGSIKLKAAAKATRPTSDRVKESLFSILENLGALRGAIVLDLFAGSGALGLESASRGASEVLFTDSDPEAIEVVKQNIMLVKKQLPKEVLLTIRRADAFFQASKLANKYSLIFLDPPYSVQAERLTLLIRELLQHTAVGGTLVVEQSSRSERAQISSPWVLLHEKSYGDTRVQIFRLESPKNNT